MKLKDKVCVVTGGAMGNGLGIVKVFLKYGAKVVILDYSEKVSEVEKEFRDKGYDVSGYLVDIRDNDKVLECVNDVYNKYGRVDVLVNNAGICRLETFDKMSDELRDMHFDINIKGTWNVTKSVLPYMREAKDGSIVNLSSVTGPMVADSGEVAYATTKAALIGFTKALAQEVVDDKIRVNAILPGYIMTPMVEGMAKESNP